MADGQLVNPSCGLTMEDRLDRLRLIRSRRVGAVTYHRLMVEHGSAKAALDQAGRVLAAAGSAPWE